MSAFILETLETLDAGVKRLNSHISRQEAVCESFGTKPEGASARRLLFLYRCERDEVLARRDRLLADLGHARTIEDAQDGRQ